MALQICVYIYIYENYIAYIYYNILYIIYLTAPQAARAFRAVQGETFVFCS